MTSRVTDTPLMLLFCISYSLSPLMRKEIFTENSGRLPGEKPAAAEWRYLVLLNSKRWWSKLQITFARTTSFSSSAVGSLTCENLSQQKKDQGFSTFFEGLDTQSTTLKPKREEQKARQQLETKNERTRDRAANETRIQSHSFFSSFYPEFNAIIIRSRHRPISIYLKKKKL